MKLTAFFLVIGVLVILSILVILYERKTTDVRKIMLIAVMTALSIVGRFVFAALPGFKPVTAIVVIAGMYLGCEAGFFCGALTALISNCYFGQGMWTPFQMLLWALIGIVAGLLQDPLKNRKFLLILYGIVAGIVYSLIMDVYSVIWMLDNFSWAVYLGMIASSLPFTVIYAVSNVFFLLILTQVMGRKLEHALSHRITRVIP